MESMPEGPKGPAKDLEGVQERFGGTDEENRTRRDSDSISDAFKRAEAKAKTARDEEHYRRKEEEKHPYSAGPYPSGPDSKPIDPRDYGLPEFKPKEKGQPAKVINFEKGPYSDSLGKEVPHLDVDRKMGNPTPKKP